MLLRQFNAVTAESRADCGVGDEISDRDEQPMMGHLLNRTSSRLPEFGARGGRLQSTSDIARDIVQIRQDLADVTVSRDQWAWRLHALTAESRDHNEEDEDDDTDYGDGGDDDDDGGDDDGDDDEGGCGDGGGNGGGSQVGGEAGSSDGSSIFATASGESGYSRYPRGVASVGCSADAQNTLSNPCLHPAGPAANDDSEQQQQQQQHHNPEQGTIAHFHENQSPPNTSSPLLERIPCYPEASLFTFPRVLYLTLTNGERELGVFGS